MAVSSTRFNAPPSWPERMCGGVDSGSPKDDVVDIADADVDADGRVRSDALGDTFCFGAFSTLRIGDVRRDDTPRWHAGAPNGRYTNLKHRPNSH